MKKARLLKGVQDQKGIAIIFALFILVWLIIFVGLAIDVGYAYVVKGELQKAADAGALAGCGKLLPAKGSPPVPAWADAEQEAILFVQKNTASGLNLTDAQVETGYWTASGMQASSYVPTGNDAPAIRVTVTKSTGKNGGPLSTFFAKVFGWKEFSLTASAVAAVKAANTMTGGMMPIAVDQTFVAAHPVINGQSTQFSFTPDDRPPNNNTKWTTFKEPTLTGGQGNGSTILDFLTNPNYVLKNPISVGDSVDITTGAKTQTYADINKHSGTLVFIAVVDSLTSLRVLRFIPFYLVSAAGGSSKTITGYFEGSVDSRFATGGNGTDYGVYRKMLVK